LSLRQKELLLKKSHFWQLFNILSRSLCRQIWFDIIILRQNRKKDNSLESLSFVKSLCCNWIIFDISFVGAINSVFLRYVDAKLIGLVEVKALKEPEKVNLEWDYYNRSWIHNRRRICLDQWFSTGLTWDSVKGATNYHICWPFKHISAPRGASKYWDNLSRTQTRQKVSETALPIMPDFQYVLPPNFTF